MLKVIDISYLPEDIKENKKEPILMKIEGFHGQFWTNVNDNQLYLFLTEQDADKIAFQLGSVLQDIEKTKKGDSNGK